jgi:hypothetical protein
MRISRRLYFVNKICSIAALGLCLGLPAGGCQVEDELSVESSTFELPSAEMLAEDSRYMAQLVEQKSQGKPFIDIDLGDERQYSFVIHRLLHAGKNPSNSPRLFQRLHQVRTKHQSSFARKARAGGVSTENNAGGGGTRCGHFLITPASVANGQFHADASSLLSCFDGVDYVYLDQAVYKTNEAESFLQYLNGSYEEEFVGINVRTAPIRGSVQAGAGYAVLVDSFSFASDDVTGDVYSTYSKWKTEAETPATISPTGAGGASALVDPSAPLAHPRDATGDEIIRFCFKRTFTAGVGDCDYAAVNAVGAPGVSPLTHIAMMEQNAAGQWVASNERWALPAPVSVVTNLLIPLEGTFNAGTRLSNGQPCDIQAIRAPDTWAALALNVTGGWCTGQPTPVTNTTQLFENLRTNLTVLKGTPGIINEVPFGVDLASDTEHTLLVDFGPDCLQNLQEADLIVSVSALTNCLATPPDRTRTAVVEETIDVRNSCFPEGTGVRRADGSVVPVEKIQVGDQILSSSDGRVLTVTATTRGVESEPMVRLVTSLGHEILLTSEHPVITNAGAVPAKSVEALAQVETEDGIATIVMVERVPYDGLVYNLSVGTDDELEMIASDERTMFAGGIRVGDNNLQFDMERQSVRESVKREVSPAWQADYQHAMARKAAGVSK